MSSYPNPCSIHSQALPYPSKYCTLSRDRLVDAPTMVAVLTCFDCLSLLTVNHERVFQALLSFFESFSWVRKSVFTSEVHPKRVLGIADHFPPEWWIGVEGRTAIRRWLGRSRGGHESWRELGRYRWLGGPVSRMVLLKDGLVWT